MLEQIGADVVASRRPLERADLGHQRRRYLLVLSTACLVVGLGGSAVQVRDRPDANHRGGVLRVVGGPELNFPSGIATPFDPVVQNSEWHTRLAAITSDGLIGFRRGADVRGSGLVPDLATAFPAISDGGRTYTFQLRTGLRYSTGAPVLAGDIRRGLERAVVHSDTTQAADSFALAIKGAKACLVTADRALEAGRKRPDCDLREGISTDDEAGTVAFHLTEPTPEFLYQLALPAASAVPQSTPVDLPLGTSLPATGPYRVRSLTLDQSSANHRTRIELVRNAHFHVWSGAAQPDGYPDRVVLEIGYTNQQAVARVSDGRADLLWLGSPPREANQLRTGHGEWLHTAPGVVLNFLFLNATKPPFNNRDARRAVAYGLDRRALTGGGTTRSEPITCQVIPEGFAGYRRYCPFTRGGGDGGEWKGPDVTTAQGLVTRSGTRGAGVKLVVVDSPAFMVAGERIVALLNRLGYKASLVVRSDFYTATGDPDSDWNAGLSGLGADYPATSTYVAYLASCDRHLNTYNAAFYCNAQIDKDIARALQLQANGSDLADRAWAEADREVVDAAAIIPYSQSVQRYYANPRVGHTLIHPITGPLLAQMWVQ